KEDKAATTPTPEPEPPPQNEPGPDAEQHTDNGEGTDLGPEPDGSHTIVDPQPSSEAAREPPKKPEAKPEPKPEPNAEPKSAPAPAANKVGEGPIRSLQTQVGDLLAENGLTFNQLMKWAEGSGQMTESELESVRSLKDIPDARCYRWLNAKTGFLRGVASAPK